MLSRAATVRTATSQAQTKRNCAKRDKARLNVFDFDGTIFRSPVPSLNMWSANTLQKIKAPTLCGGFGWFHNKVSLEPPYVPETPSAQWYNWDVVKEIKRSMKDDDAITVLLTGRPKNFDKRIRSILDAQELYFDQYILKDTRGCTHSFKEGAVSRLLEAYTSKHVQMWDDRESHCKAFDTYLKEHNSIVSHRVHHITDGCDQLPVNLETDIVHYLARCVDREHLIEPALQI